MAKKKYLVNTKKRQDLAKRLASVIKDLQEIYMEVTEDEFLDLFALMGGGTLMLGPILDVVRFYYPDKKRFKVPSFMETYRLDQAYQKWGDFQRALDDFKSGRKGSRGGLKLFRKEFIEIKEERLFMLKEFKGLKEIDKEKLSEKEREKLQVFVEQIPIAIREKIQSTGIRTLVLEWMVMDYPCTLSTLKQILSRKPKRK